MQKRILAILASLHPERDYSSSTDFIEDDLIDSIDVVMITTMIEAEFNISIPGDVITPDNFASVEKLSNLIHNLQGGGA